MKMTVERDSEVLSDVELVLPFKVICDFQSLEKNARACYIAVNKDELTSTQLTVDKQSDDSVRLRVTVLALASSSENKQHWSDTKQNTTVDASVADENGQHESPCLEAAAADGGGGNYGDEKLSRAGVSLRDKHGAETTKKRPPLVAADVSDGDARSTVVCVAGSEDELPKLTCSNVDKGDDNNAAAGQAEDSENDDGAGVDPMASTVIILKTANKQMDSDNEHWAYGNNWPVVAVSQSVSDHHQATEYVDIQVEFVDASRAADLQPQFDAGPVVPSRASLDIAERLKARKRQFMQMNSYKLDASNASSSVSSSSPSVSCELCGECVEGYSQLVKHVGEQHEDCTFVRTYLDEIKPLAAMQTTVSLPCAACGRTFSGQAALSAHKYECGSAKRAVSKLGALRQRIKAAAKAKSDGGGGDAGTNQQATNKCDTCSKVFKSVAKLHKHESTHLELNGDQPVEAKRTKLKDGKQKKRKRDTAERTDDNLPKHASREHCGKKFHLEKTLQKHVLKVHRSGKKAKGKAKPSTPGVAMQLLTSKPSSASVNSVGSAETLDKDLQEFRCNHCRTTFGRMSLLVTHTRYCLKAQAASHN